MGGFTFKKFHISQEHAAMKVGTDGVLLGAWARGGSHILDVGTGTGVIALMMAQRYTDAEVDAIDIDSDACIDARMNVANSPWPDRVSVENTSFKDFALKAVDDSYDSIVSNPPYFAGKIHDESDALSRARMNDSLPFAELARLSWRLLREGGRLSVVIPFDYRRAIETECLLIGFRLTRLTAIRTTPKKAPRRYLIAFSKKSADVSEMQETCLLDADGTRSEWYEQLTRDFYL